MLALNNEILAHLRRGGTLLVPSRQRAVAVRLAFSSTMLAEGLRVWSTPDVLPWTAWLERELDMARARGEIIPRRLSAQEEWLLWQEAVHEACSGFSVIMPDAIIDPVRRATGLLDDYGLTLAGAAGLVSAEAAVLQTSRLHFMRRCEELKVLGSTSWRDLRQYLRPSPDLMLAGFFAVGPARRGWLAQHGVRIASESLPDGSMQVMECNSPSHEADAAAQWCASRLAKDPSERLLIVVPQLAEQRHLWERSFSQQLDHASILSGDHSSGTASYAIEGGRPLNSYRLVATALHLIALASGHAQFDQLSEVLRSPYLSVLDRNECLRIDRWLRERNVDTAQPTVLRSLLPLLTRDLKDVAAATAVMLIDALEAASRHDAAAPSEWAQHWVALLNQCGWPGRATLKGDEQQARVRFDEVLGDFAAVAVLTRQLRRDEAFQRLHKMTQRVSFEPATDDVPVTISARLEDPIVRYDGLWVAGLTAGTWPPAARPDSLLPLAMQYSAGISEASADGQLQLALQLQRCWQRTANNLICSWPRSVKDLPHDRSPLIEQPSATDNELIYQPSGDSFSLEYWQVAHAPVMESWSDVSPPAVTSGGVLKGGTRLLELQSLCPFRAFAELRLKAQPLEQPSPGIDPGVRGKIVHSAVESFWRSLGDQATLRASSATAISELTDRCVAQAMQETIAGEPGEFPAELLRREHLRTTNLIAQLIKWELGRPAFETRELESTQLQVFSGATLELRLDRVDRLQDGSLVVIDYKSGKPKKFDALAPRLPQPQLPAYAVVSGAQVAAVVSVFLGREGAAPRGLADRPDRVPRLATLKEGEPTWVQLMQQWQQQLQSLTQEFLRGEAAVRPQPDACKFCHLQIVCRIDPASIPKPDDEDDTDASPDADAEADIDAEEYFE